MKKLLAFLGIITTVAVGSAFAQPVTVTIPWVYSQGVPSFAGGDLAIGEYGVTDTGQILFNIDGTLRSYDEYTDQYTLAEVQALNKRPYTGSRYEDVFRDGTKTVVTKAQYEIPNRKPVKTALSFIPEAYAAIAVEDTATSAPSYVNSITIAVDCGAASNPGVIAMVANRVQSEITGITYNSVALTREANGNNVNVAGVSIWSLNAASTSINNLVLSNSQYRLHSLFGACLSGTDQTDIVEATNSVSSGFSTSVTLATTSVTNNAWFMSGTNLQNDYALTPDTGETELEDFDHSDANLGRMGVSYYEKATAGSETIGWSWSTNDNNVMALVVVKPAAAAGGGGSTAQSVIWFE